MFLHTTTCVLFRLMFHIHKNITTVGFCFLCTYIESIFVDFSWINQFNKSPTQTIYINSKGTCLYERDWDVPIQAANLGANSCNSREYFANCLCCLSMLFNIGPLCVTPFRVLSCNCRGFVRIHLATPKNKGKLYSLQKLKTLNELFYESFLL